MLKRFHKLAKLLAVVFLLIVIAGVGAPYLRADYFEARIQAGLEQSLGRKIKMRHARYNVFRGPGFQVEEVTIAEDSRVGIEPFAHVAEVQARVDVWSLFRGEIRFSNLRMVEPTINFARTDAGGPWNVELFLERAPTSQLPPIQIRDGRVNFKFGDRKALVYLGNVDLDISPAQSGRALQLVTSAEPFRNDRPAHGVGMFHIRSTIANGTIDGELEAERSSIAEIAKLLGARDPGLRGFVSSSFALKGPLSAVDVKGELKLDDLSGGVILPKSNAGALPVAGRLNLHKHELELHTAGPASGSAGALPLMIRLEAKDYLATPDWSGQIKFEGFAAPALLETVKRLGANVPDGFGIDKGTVSGTVDFARLNGIKGDVTLDGSELKLPSGGQLKGVELQFEVTGKDVDLKVHSTAAEPPARLVDGKYDLESSTLNVRLQTRGTMPISETLQLVPDSPLLSKFRQGNWRGTLRYTSAAGEPPQWSGQMEILDAVVDIEGLSSPATVAFVAAIDGDRLNVKSLRGSCGKVSFTGDYRYDVRAARPHKLNINAEQMDLAEVERILRPTLARGTFLSKTLRIGRTPVPEWLADRKMEGTIHIAKLSMGSLPTKFEKVAGKYTWTGVKGQIDEMKAKGEDGLEVSVDVAIDLTGAQPKYKASGTATDVSFAGGHVTFEGSLNSDGLGAALLTHLQSKGDFQARGVRFNPEWLFDEVTGNYGLTVVPSPATGGGSGWSPRVVLTDLSLTQAGEVYQGQGVTQADGKVALELTGGPRKQLKLLGSLQQPSAPKPQ